MLSKCQLKKILETDVLSEEGVYWEMGLRNTFKNLKADFCLPKMYAHMEWFRAQISELYAQMQLCTSASSDQPSIFEKSAL